MVWEQLAIDKPHLVYIILGGFTSLFMLCSSVIKERLYIGEATVATICGIIFGPHAANLIDPSTWGNVDKITLEFSRIVLVVQCFAVGVELPKSYMERHWRSVTLLLIPVMTFGWLATSLFIWGLIPGLNWLDSLCIAACVTATDPVLASSVVGKGKFAKRVPKHLRDLLSAESGCNDGMAFPFIYLALYIIRYRGHPDKVALHWFCNTILYECIFGAVFGVVVGYAARRAIRYAHERDLIDRESFLVFYFVLALFCAGAGSILGLDDLLVGFACGVGFSNDGWFTEKTEEAHVSNVIDLLINLAFFVYFGAIIPWNQFNADVLHLNAWRLVVLGILVLLFRRLPIMLALKPIIPDIKTWREALFAGHFGPIGVGAIFVAILARAELETETTTPLAVLPEPGFEHLNIIELIWPITTFLVIVSIIVHGSSIAVFTLGKRINTLTLTMSYTTANEDGPSWTERLPRIQSRSRSSMSARRPDEESSLDEKADYAPDSVPANFLRRQKEEDTPSKPRSRRRSRKHQWDSGRGPGGPISQSAIAPQRKRDDDETRPSNAPRSDSEEPGRSPKKDQDSSESPDEREAEIFEEGDQTVYEDEEGNVLEVEDSREIQSDEPRESHERAEGRRLVSDEDIHHGVARKEHNPYEEDGPKVLGKMEHAGEEPEKANEQARKDWRQRMKRMGHWGDYHHQLDEKGEEVKEKPKPETKRGPARAYQFGNTIIVEDEDGEVLKTYDIPAPPKKNKGDEGSGAASRPGRFQRRMSTAMSLAGWKKDEAGPSDATEDATDGKRKRGKDVGVDEDDERLRFTINTGGHRMSKAEFIQQIQQLDPRARAKFVEGSDVPDAIKEEAGRHAKSDRKGLAKDLQRLPTDRSIMVPAREPEGYFDTAVVKQVRSGENAAAGPEGLTLIDSNDQDIPLHDVSGQVRNMKSGSETPAQRRRVEAMRRASSRQQQQQSQQPLVREEEDEEEEDSEDDGTERIPPSRPQHQPRLASDVEGETAAERRRREGALGVSNEESESSEDETEPQQAPQSVRFAEPVRPETQRQQAGTGTGGSRLKWGKNVGR